MILRLERFFSKNSPLEKFAHNVTSQHGEDGIIAHILNAIQPAAHYCVEFGAWDGKLYSNCYNLLQGNAWSGLMIEASAEKFPKLQKTYENNPKVSVANRLVDFEGPNRLDAILREVSAPASFGLLSIDIDGNDYYVWESLAEYAPEVVVIEFNPSVPNDVVFVQDKSFGINQGCSLLALVQLGRKKGYELAVCTVGNAFFVRQDKFPRLGLADNSINTIFAPLLDGRIFQGFDNSIHVVGMDRMVWLGMMPLTSEDFQIFPKAMRVWRDGQKKPR